MPAPLDARRSAAGEGRSTTRDAPSPRVDRRPARPDAGPTGGRGAAADDRPDAAPVDGGTGGHEVFQYALLRVVPSMQRGEGLNVGIVLHARRHRFLGLRTVLDPERLRALDPGLDLAALREHLDGLARIAEGAPGAGAIAAMPRSDRFGWLAAPSNTMIQPSPVHTGVCDDPEAMLERLVARLVRVG